jgi:hypothetical protein
MTAPATISRTSKAVIMAWQQQHPGKGGHLQNLKPAYMLDFNQIWLDYGFVPYPPELQPDTRGICMIKNKTKK